MPKIGESKKWRYVYDVVLLHASDQCLIWPFYRLPNGYGYIGIPGSRKKEVVSRIVCEKAHGSPPTCSHEAAHSCGNGHLGCVNPKHLRWATPKENQADKILHGTTNRGERQWKSKLDPSKVKQIRQLALDTPQPQIAAQFDIRPSTVSRIISRHAWAWLP